MLKKIYVISLSIIVFGFFLLPVVQVVMAQDKAGDANPDVPTSYIRNNQAEEIKTIIGKNTPNFLAKPIIFIVEALESFRQNNFNNPFIFYGVFFIFLFIIVRTIWRFFFA